MNRGTAAAISAGGTEPAPLPEISSPEPRRTDAGSVIVAPAACPTSTRRTGPAVWLSPRRVTAWMAASAGAPHR
jgi:hypothetical protein